MASKWILAIRGKVPYWAVVVLGAIPIVVFAGLWFLVTSGAPEE